MLSFAQLQGALALHLGVHSDERAAFASRLKQLQRLGVPRGVNNGRAKRVSYTAAQLLEIAFVLELLRCGLPPQRAIVLVDTWWDWLRRAFLTARDRPFDVAVAFLQNDFVGSGRADTGDSDTAAPADDGCVIIGLDPADTRTQRDETLSLLTRSRAITLNVTALLKSLTTALQQMRVESAFVWAQTEPWRGEQDALGRSINLREARNG